MCVWGGGGGGAENTFFSVTPYNFQKSVCRGGRGEVKSPKTLPLRGLLHSTVVDIDSQRFRDFFEVIWDEK